MSKIQGNTAHWSRILQLAAQARGHRAVLVLAGTRDWGQALAQSLVQPHGWRQILWVTDQAPAESWSIPSGKYARTLGREADAVIYDAWAGFNPDAFGAVAGIIRRGGMLLLLTPPLTDWPHFSDPEYRRIAVAPFTPAQLEGLFLQRLVKNLRQAERQQQVVLIEQGRPLPQLPEPAPASTQKSPREVSDPACCTPDQQAAVAALIKVVQGRRRRPVVLTSDRGRGKSAALGIAAARLLQGGAQRIVVTAPRLDAVTEVFTHATRLLPQAQGGKGALHDGQREIRFVAPDELLRSAEEADLVLVDEAAAIPAPLLEQLLIRYARIAFATTIHGYEGTGRGFAVRFQQVLDQRTPNWRALRLEQPVRWSPGDPLEQWVFKALLMDAEAAAEADIAQAQLESCTIQRVPRSRLVQDEAILSELFGLLVLAHYRTRPEDLRNLLDGPNLSIYTLCFNGHVVATALVAQEGGFDAELAQAIWAGQRRPRGHLIPQSLATHGGLLQAPGLHGARIMRIAVHPAVQGRGLGRHLVDAISRDARNNGLDWLGASFGATPELLDFWAQCGCRPVRLGVSRDASSGTHSAIVLHSLSDAGDDLIAVAHRRFSSQLPLLLGEVLQDVEPALVALLLRQAGDGTVNQPEQWILDTQDWRDVIGFVYANRVYEVCAVPIWKLACQALSDPDGMRLLEPEAQSVLILKVLQHKSWSEVAPQLQLAGRNAVIAALKQALRPLAAAWADAESRHLIPSE